MSAKHEFKRNIKTILIRNRDGSYSTQAARSRSLTQVVEDLIAGGYKLSHPRGLKQKHIKYLVEHWQAQGITPATLKNRTAHLRWLCQHVGKRDVVVSNDELNIPKRVYLMNQNKSFELSDIRLDKITNPFVNIQLHLQRHFGLRREEAIKIQPHIADKGNYVELHPSWCKGGRGRVVPIHTAEARHWLNEAKALVKNAHDSLVGNSKNYKAAQDTYDQQAHRAGIKNPHGLRHAYAQALYKEITGRDCPARGGLLRCQLSEEQRTLDHEARLTISEHLGHSRLSISELYIGR